MSAENTNVCEKRPLNDIILDSETIDVERVASEVLLWATNNVENFIDDNMKVFKLDLVLDASEGMQETKKLQDLYRSIPEDRAGMSNSELGKTMECRTILNEITENVHRAMVRDEEAMNKLFERMIFYYEKIIPNPENKVKAFEIDAQIRELMSKKDKSKSEKTKAKIQEKILAKIDEGVKLLQFQKFDGKVTIPKFEYEAFDVGVQIKDPRTGEVQREYDINEGFTCWIELSYGIKKRPTAMF